MSVRCGNRAHEDRQSATHATVAEVRTCYLTPGGTATELELSTWQWEMESEAAAEAACERYYEEGPHGPVDDPRERELWAMEDMARENHERAEHMRRLAAGEDTAFADEIRFGAFSQETLDLQARDRADDARAAASKAAAEDEEHDSPCVCSVYDRCKRVRAREFRRGDKLAMYRAYND